MINLKYLIRFLPHYFKATDTYKNEEGKGILERFLEISGEYLEEFITPEIDSLLDIIKVDKTETQYLNYIWEFLGEIPFAYGCHIDKEKWDLYHQNYDNPEELAKLAKQWEIEKTGPIVLTEDKVRNILKYAITLLKIRGTKRFFEFIFKLYDIGCQITDPSDNKDANFWLKYDTKFDEPGLKMDLKQTRMDKILACSPCSIVRVNIEIGSGGGGDEDNAFRDINSIVFRGSDSIIFGGKYKTQKEAIDALAGLPEEEKVIYFPTNQEEYELENAELIAGGIIFPLYDDFRIFREMMDKFFYRFMPFNVIPHLTFQGYEIDDHVEIQSVEFVDPRNTSLVYLVNNKVGLKVTVTSNWPYTRKKYRVSYSPDPETEAFSKPGQPHSDTEIFYAYKPGTYRFSALDDKTKYKDVVISSQVDEKAYSIVLVNSIPSNLTIGPDNFVKVQLKATLTYKGQVTDCRIRLRGTTESYKSNYFWELKQPGIYQFEIVEFPVKYYELEVLKTPTIYHIECNPKSIALQETEGILRASTTVKVSDNYNTPGLTITNINTGETYPNNSTIVFYSIGIYTFKCTQDTSKNPVTATFLVTPTRAIQYGVKVSPEISTITKYGDIEEGRTYVKCNLIKGEPTSSDLDFRVKCEETGEIFSAGPSVGHKFASDIPSTYTFVSMADPTAKAKWLLKPYKEPHQNGLFISPIEPEDPNWGTHWGPDPESTVAVYNLQGGVCKFMFRLYIGGKLIDDETYKVSFNLGDQKIEYDLNSPIYLNEMGVIDAMVTKGNTYMAKLIIGDTFNNYLITSSKGTNISVQGVLSTTIITCTNEGGRDGTDMLWYKEGSQFRNRVSSPYTFILNSPGRFWFVPADVSPEEQQYNRFSINVIKL